MEKFPMAEEENEIESAAEGAGLYEVEIPKPGTKAYEALMDVARKYIETIKMIETFKTKKAGDRSPKTNIGALDAERRKLHDQLCVKLEGRHEDELDLEDQEKITNFAAILMNEEDYVIKRSSQSQASYFHSLGE